MTTISPGKDEIIREVESVYFRKEPLPEFKVGDTIKIWMRLKEGDKERLQPFTGVVISRKGEGLGESFTVRNVFSGVGVERTFPYHSPLIEKIEVLKRGRVRRAKLYYLREKKGKEAKVKEERRS